jgi:glycosyltransferase involved in cell wall biosynthesis
MIFGKKVAAVIVAYNAEKTLGSTISGIPLDTADDIIIVDDASTDGTLVAARQFPTAVIIHHQKNKGYGAAQKSGYRAALERGADIIVMLHGDFQYDPVLLPDMARPLALGEADACFGSRMQSKKNAWKNGMPWWRFTANIALSKLEERIFRLGLSEYHTGYRAYTKETLERIPFEKNSDDFVFDSQIFAQLSLGKFRATEISIPTRYFKEALSINFRRSVKYGLQTLGVAIRFVSHKNGVKKYANFLIGK